MSQTMQACFGHRTRSIQYDRLIPSSRRDPFSIRGVSRLTRYNPSRRLLSRRMKWRSIGTHDPATINIHPASAPRHQPARARVRPCPPGPRCLPLGTPVTPNPHPPTPKFGGPACMRPGARGPFAVRPVSGRPRRSRTPGSPSQPRVQAGVGSRSRECPRGCAGGARTCPRFRVGGCTGELAG